MIMVTLQFLSLSWCITFYLKDRWWEFYVCLSSCLIYDFHINADDDKVCQLISIVIWSLVVWKLLLKDFIFTFQDEDIPALAANIIVLKVKELNTLPDYVLANAIFVPHIHALLPWLILSNLQLQIGYLTPLPNVLNESLIFLKIV